MSVAATRDLGATSNASAEQAPKRILVVDDKPDTFEDLKEALAPSGTAWQMEYAGGGDAALAALEREPVDVVIAEDQMASMDGVALLTRVRDQHPTTIRMIVSATTRPGLATIVSHRFLSKPCNADELAVLIKRSCALHERTGEVEAFRKTMATTALPSRPGVYMELNRVLSDPDWQPHQVSAVLERDVAMTAKVLQLANSALFGLTSTVTSVRDAVMYLGVDTIRSLSLTAEAFGKLSTRGSEDFSLDDFQSPRHAGGADHRPRSCPPAAPSRRRSRRRCSTTSASSCSSPTAAGAGPSSPSRRASARSLCTSWSRRPTASPTRTSERTCSRCGACPTGSSRRWPTTTTPARWTGWPSTASPPCTSPTAWPTRSRRRPRASRRAPGSTSSCSTASGCAPGSSSGAGAHASWPTSLRNRPPRSGSRGLAVNASHSGPPGLWVIVRAALNRRPPPADYVHGMRRLVKNQAVRVDLDAKVDWDINCIECRVRSIQGPVATLIPEGDITDEVQTRLTSGSLCFLTFEHGRAPVALRGVALKAADRDELEFVVVDGIQVAERRSAERTQLVTAVKATPVELDGTAGESVATVTSNLSMGGALLLKRPGLGDVSRWRVELFLPGDPEHVHCEAVLARETPTHLGVRLVNVQEADQLRIAGVLAGLQRAAPALA